MGCRGDISRLKDHLPGGPPRDHQALDVVTGALRTGALHEWFGLPGSFSGEGWTPPLAVLVGVAQAAVRDPGLGFRVAWIGRRCWPSPLFLHRSVVASSVFIDPPDDAARLWCVDVASRCLNPTLVIADGSGVTLANTRRLQLASACGASLCVLARPPWEERELSAATTRWVVTRAISSSRRPRWAVTVLRNKDRPVFTEDRPSVVVEFDHASGLVCVPAPLAHREACAPAQAS